MRILIFLTIFFMFFCVQAHPGDSIYVKLHECDDHFDTKWADQLDDCKKVFKKAGSLGITSKESVDAYLNIVKKEKSKIENCKKKVTNLTYQIMCNWGKKYRKAALESLKKPKK